MKKVSVQVLQVPLLQYIKYLTTMYKSRKFLAIVPLYSVLYIYVVATTYS